MKENKLNIILIIFAFILGLGVMFGIMFLTKEKCEVCEKCPDVKEQLPKDELSADQSAMFNLLTSYANTIYEKTEYTNFKKNDEGVYYATLTDLNNLNYDVSTLSNCDQDTAMIFFDVEHKMAAHYEGAPLQVSVTCVANKK